MTEALPTATRLLVLGGARSGKSSFAQAQAEVSGRELVFVATAHAYDEEMRERIARHAAARDGRWRLVEAPHDLEAALLTEAAPQRCLLVDCMTLWLSNVMLRGDAVAERIENVTRTVAALRGPLILVSNEVGGGIVPDTPLGRRFRDAQGTLNQRLAGVCENVVLVTAGLPLRLKPSIASF